MKVAEFDGIYTVKSKLSADGQINVNADSAHLTTTGDLVFKTMLDGEAKVVFAIAAGLWTAVYAVSVNDGTYAIAHWPGVEGTRNFPQKKGEQQATD